MKKFEDRKMVIAREMGLSKADVPYATKLFHGTSRGVAMNIVENGFKVSKANANGMFGQGMSIFQRAYNILYCLVAYVFIFYTHRNLLCQQVLKE